MKWQGVNRKVGLVGGMLLLVLVLVLSACSSAKPAPEAQAAALPPAPPIEKVRPLIEKGGCANCHTIPGIEGATGTVGPEWCDPAKEVQAGKANLAFLREAIVEPNKEIAKGYQPNIMPQNFGDLFSDEEISTLVAFIANLKCEE